MDKKTVHVFYIVVVAILLASCTIGATEQEAPTRNSRDITQTSPIGPKDPITYAQTLVARSDYLEGCISINPLKISGQVSYRDIWPGTTTSSQLESLLGAPNSISMDNTNWVYDDVGFLLDKGVVTDILTGGEETSGLTAMKIIQKYGCPNIVFARHISVDLGGGFYNWTLFNYYTLGIEFGFSKYPIHLSEIPINEYYFRPMSLEEYLKHIDADVVGIELNKPVGWDEAVLQSP